jgi:site-specific DNA-methyltransferase (adenine-specific)
MTEKLVAAFRRSSLGYSPDRVVADPALNKAFLKQCKRIGISGSAASLNHALLNLRKRGGMRGLGSKRSSLPRASECRFAAEMAVRFIERRDNVTLDDILCDPHLADEFDELSARLCPGYRPVEYRWAALGLRKARGLAPEILGRVVKAITVQTFPCRALDIDRIPAKPGLYMFIGQSEVLYVGEAEDLNRRVRKHLNHSDNKGLARGLWDQGVDDLHLEIQVLPSETPARVRRALEIELIRSRKSIFNVKR